MMTASYISVFQRIFHHASAFAHSPAPPDSSVAQRVLMDGEGFLIRACLARQATLPARRHEQPLPVLRFITAYVYTKYAASLMSE